MAGPPGTINSNIVGQFFGFSPQTLFKLQDNSFWLQTGMKTLLHRSLNPEVTILEQDGEHFLEVEGLEETVQVVPLHGVIESRIRGKFSGWQGRTVYTLTNGEKWQQAKFLNKYMTKYMPEVLIYESPHGHIMQVAGTRVKVRRIG